LIGDALRPPTLLPLSLNQPHHRSKSVTSPTEPQIGWQPTLTGVPTTHPGCKRLHLSFGPSWAARSSGRVKTQIVRDGWWGGGVSWGGGALTGMGQSSLQIPKSPFSSRFQKTGVDFVPFCSWAPGGLWWMVEPGPAVWLARGDFSQHCCGRLVLAGRRRDGRVGSQPYSRWQPTLIRAPTTHPTASACI